MGSCVIDFGQHVQSGQELKIPSQFYYFILTLYLLSSPPLSMS
jgi:hypothetical protein